MTHRAASASATCPACGVGTPAGARFCPACGQRLGGGVDERRVVTVLFADLVDSTSLVTSLDPEAARDLLNETFRRLAAEVRRFGGTLEKYVGDAILAVFGFPTGHDDDAARAVRAGLAMRDIVKTAETALGDLPLHLRIGLDTGEVAAGPWSGDLRVTGPPVHTAARIQQAAEPDQILLSTRTLRAARDIVEVGPAGRGGGGAGAVPGRAGHRPDGGPRRRPAPAGRRPRPRRPPQPAGPAGRRRRGRQVGPGPGGHGRAGRPGPGAVGPLPARLAEPALCLARGTVRGATGDLDGALAGLGRASGSARAPVRAQAWTELSNLQVSFGRSAEAAAAAGRALAEAAEAGQPGLVAQATRAKAYIPYLAGDLDGAGRAAEADAAAKRVLTDATAMGAHALVRRLARQGGNGR